MPLARIISRNSEEALAVADYLRDEGYTVETVAPGEFRVTPADLELDLGRSKRGEAMDRARALVQSRHAAAEPPQEAPSAPDPVANGKAKIPIAYDIVGRPVAFAENDEEPEPVHKSQGYKSDDDAPRLGQFFSRLSAPLRDFRRRRAEARARTLAAQLARQRQARLARERAQQELDQRRAEAALADQRRREQIAAERLADEQRAQAALVRQAGISAAREVAPQKQAASERPAGAPDKRSLSGNWEDKHPRRASSSGAPRQAPSVILRRSAATALTAAVLFVGGFAVYANRRPASPLSPEALQFAESVKQEVPFGPVVLTAPAAPVRTIPASRRTGSAGKRRQSAARGGSDDVAVRHPRPSARHTASTATPKQYSDTN